MSKNIFKTLMIVAILVFSSLVNISQARCEGTLGFAFGYIKDNPGAVFKFVARENIGIIKAIVNKDTANLAVNFAVDNSESIINYVSTHKIPDQLAKGNEAIIALGVKYATENKQNLNEYISQNKENIKNAVAKNKVQDIAIDYGLKNSNNVLGFVAANKTEIANLSALKNATKGSGSEVALGLKYVAENHESIASYITQNRDSIAKDVKAENYGKLGTDYLKKTLSENPDSLLKFVVNNKKDVMALNVVKENTKGFEGEVALGLKYIAENRSALSNYLVRNPKAVNSLIDKGDFKPLLTGYGKTVLENNPEGLINFVAANKNEIRNLNSVKGLIKGYEGETDLGLEYLAQNKKSIAGFLSQNKGLIEKSFASGKFEDIGLGYALADTNNLADFAIKNNAKIKQLPLFKKLISQLSSDGNSSNETGGNTESAGNTGNSGNSGNAGGNGNTGNAGGGTGNAGETGGKENTGTDFKIKEKLIDFIVANPETGIKLIDAYKDVLTSQLVKGYETEVKYSIAYLTEEREAFCKYLRNNQFAKNALLKGNYKDLAIDYIKSEPMSVINFVVRHRGELPADVIDLALKYAVKDKTLATLIKTTINNKNIDTKTVMDMINKKTGIPEGILGTVGKTIGLPDKISGNDAKKVIDFLGNISLFRAPSDTTGTAGQSPAATSVETPESAPLNTDPALLKAAKDRMENAYKRYLSENTPAEGPVLEEYKNAVESYKKITGAK